MSNKKSLLSLLAALAFGVVNAASAATVIKIATAAPEGSAWMREMRAGGDAIKAATEGRVELKFYPGGVMGNNEAVIRKIKLGQLQGGAFTGAEISPVYKDAPVYSIPFLFRNQAEVDAVRAKIDPLLKKGFEDAGFIAPGMSGGGFAYLLSTKPIHNRDDLRATKVWTPASDRIAQVAFEAGGVSPTALPITDVYTGLQTGLIETVANTTAGTIAFQWHTKLKYMVDLPLTYVIGILVIDKKVADTLSAADRATLDAEIGKAFAKIDSGGRVDNASARDALIKGGLQMFTPSADEAKFWEGVGEESDKRLAKEGAFTPSLVAAMKAALAEARAGKSK